MHSLQQESEGFGLQVNANKTTFTNLNKNETSPL